MNSLSSMIYTIVCHCWAKLFFIVKKRLKGRTYKYDYISTILAQIHTVKGYKVIYISNHLSCFSGGRGLTLLQKQAELFPLSNFYPADTCSLRA